MKLVDSMRVGLRPGRWVAVRVAIRVAVRVAVRVSESQIDPSVTKIL